MALESGRNTPPKDRHTIKSGQSIDPSYIVLHNMTERPINVYWIDFEAQPLLFNPRGGPIKPTGHIPINTYTSHPWMFCDARTGERMHVNHSKVFWPPPWYENVVPKNNRLTRTHFNIHLPMRSLKVIAQEVVGATLKSEEAIKALELPDSLCRDLAKVLQERELIRKAPGR